nr:MAG TPA: nucelotide kinase [Caudoviricetes sp.]
MIKIYKVNTFEKFEYLLNTLHERGAKWSNGNPLNNKAQIHSTWGDCGDGVVIYKRDESVTFSNFGYIKEALEGFENKGEEYLFIKDVKLPNSKHSEDDKPIADATDSSQVEQPSHYIGEKGLEVREIEENFLVRYQDGHLAHLAGALLEYLLRAPSKGKLEEDIQKVKYLANEMAEYVEKVKEAR